MNWQEDVDRQAHFFSSDMQKAFSKRMNESLKLLPNRDRGNIEIQVGLFLDALVTTTVVIATEYVNHSKELEEFIVADISKKFGEMRKQALMETSQEPNGQV